MYACICRAVTVREVKRAVRDGAHDVAAIGAATGAGTCCGGCHGTLDGILERAGYPSAGTFPVPADGAVLLPLATSS